MAGINIRKMVSELVLIIVFIYIAAYFGPTVGNAVNNLTGQSNDAAFGAIITFLYYILVTVAAIMAMLYAFLPKSGRRWRG